MEKKTLIRNWWQNHPMNYKDCDPLAEQKDFTSADQIFIRTSWWAHKTETKENGFFGNLIPYSEIKGKRVLEVGCGLGLMASEMVKEGANLVAIDLTFNAAQATQKRLLESKHKGYVLQADGENLPFKANSFDFVWSWGVLHHSPEIIRAFCGINNVLKENGKFGVMVYNKNSVYHWNLVVRTGIMRGQFFKFSLQELRNRYTDGANYGGNMLTQFFSLKDMKKMLNPLEIYKVKRYDPLEMELLLLPKFMRNWVLEKLPLKLRIWLMDKTGFMLFVLARKSKV